MSILDEIKKNKADIFEIQNRIELSSARSAKKLLSRLKELEFNQETAIMNYLEKNNPSYEQLVQENFDLLINDNIDFVVMSEQMGFWSSHAVEMKGSVHNNGYFYGRTTETDASLFKITNNFYPLGYTGLINYMGESEFQISKKKYTFFGSRVPQKYKGSIDYNGNVRLETIDTFFELNGSVFVSSIIADLFSGNSEKRARFLNNKSELYDKINDFKGDI